MPVTISQQDYWDLIYETQRQPNLNHNDKFDVTWQYPEELGQGTYRQIQLRQGIVLDITRYHLHDYVIVQSPERSHVIEFNFAIAGKSAHIGKFLHNHSTVAGQYELFGSGTASIERWERSTTELIMRVGVHIEPELFQAFLGDCELASIELVEHLMRSSDRYYNCIGTTTVAMQTVLHQILHCPYMGITKKIYLESKVWELMALLIEDERERHQSKRSVLTLNPDDIDRIYHAREILSNSLDNPPSLAELARLIGSNEYTLKRGFREVLDTTVFGYLYQQRMEYARQLLLERKLNVAQVAKKAGYASRSNFAIAFRKKFGVNPKAFMKQQQGWAE
ncbi:MAG: AraC family transcriptional regulator [Pleurocapsa sp. MO_226.B13]|nr:AraC family transcriptional regulator [Pleurocapsa sp. MO_226.B13]